VTKTRQNGEAAPPSASLPLAELELHIALLPPISRVAHLDGPRLHAKRLVALWRPDDEVSLAEAFRLLDVETVVGVILRATIEREERDDCRRDPRHWHFPPFANLLPSLREAAWQKALAGKLVLEAIKSVRGKRHRTILPAELPRQIPDWELARLILGDRDEFIAVRVRRPPAESVKATWREQIPEKALENAMQDIALAHEGKTRPREKDIVKEMRDRLRRPDLPRDVILEALKNYAPQLKRGRGEHGNKLRS
jgi:hypothetical protein